MANNDPCQQSQTEPAHTTSARSYSTLSAVAKARRVMRRLADGKAQDIKGVDLAGTGKNSCMDAVVIATAKSSRHARSLTDALAELATTEHFEWLRMEGYQNGEWILSDMNDVIVHVFLAETRELFRMESLWSDAAEISPESSGEDDEACAADAGEPVPTVLLILDGYGLAEPGSGNAASLADTPNINRLLSLPERVSLAASGRAVGLPEGFMGNSEVGHLNIGAGRVVYQDMTRIDIAVESGEIARNQALCALLEAAAKRNGRIHFAGLLSDGGVHSHIRHLEALLRVAADHGVPAVVHAFMDGRDTPPTSGIDFVRALAPCLEETGARLGSLVGRFYAMDRDKRWERVKVAWDMLVHGLGKSVEDAVGALEAAYAEGETDEFLKPLLLGAPEDVSIRDNDGVFFFNFRADRARELVSAFHLADFEGFDRGEMPDLCGLASMTAYDATLDIPVAFPKDNVSQTLGEVVSGLGLSQLRIAETEKYAHVTYFFNGGREEAFAGEKRILVDSPRDVATYDLKPQMSAEEVTEKLLAAWASERYTFAVCNLANPDMVGHTGVIPAALSALKTVDECVGRIAEAVEASGGRLVLTADHGNVEEMINVNTGEPHTAHTCNPVPLLVLDRGRPVPLREGGKLGDIAPTILALWNVEKPAVMTGNSLLEEEPE